MTDTNTAERESFEAWYISKTRDSLPSSGDGWSDDQIRDSFMGLSGNAQYRSSSAQLSWDAWQARASLAASAGSEPVAWAIFAENGNIRMWSAKPDQVKTCATETGQKPVPLYANPSPRNGMVLVPREPTPEMLRAGDQKTWALPSLDCWRAMLDAAPANPSPPEGMAGWKPIATAPKYTEHGVRQHLLLGYAPDEIHEDGFVSQGYWMESEEDAPDNMGHDGGWVDVHFDFFSCGRSFGAEAYRSAGTQPTHWKPLPAPPLPASEAKEPI